MRTLIVTAVFLGVCEYTKAQDLKTKPQYERMLKGEDAKKADEYEKKIRDLDKNGKRDEAAKLAQELLTFRIQLQGEDHWEVRDLQVRVKDLQLSQSEMQRQQLRESLRLAAQFSKLYRQGDYKKATNIQKKELAACKAAQGDQHPDYATSLNNLAELYRLQADYSKAEPLYKQAMKIRKDTLGVKHPDYATSLNNLGVMYQEMGEFSKVEPLHKESLRIRKEALGEHHVLYADSLNNLGILYSALSNYLRAKPLYAESLNIRKAVLGNQHPDYADSLNNLAYVYQEMAEYAKAEPLYKEALLIRKKSLGEKHPKYGQSLNNLAHLYKHQEKYSEAVSLYKDALRIQKAILEESHPDYALYLNNLASLYEDQGDYKQAEVLFRESLRIRKKALGEKHPAYAESLDNLAGLYSTQGEYSKAEPLRKDALSIRKQVYGIEHLDTASSLNNLAGHYVDIGKIAESEALYIEALRIRKMLLGEKHPDYASCLNNLAHLYSEGNDYEKSKMLYLEALKIRKDALGDKHTDYASSLNSLAQNHVYQAEYALAEPLFKEALQIYKSTLGEKHPSYANCLFNLASLYESIGDFAKSEPYYKESIQLCKNALGEIHPVYAQKLNNLSVAYINRGEFTKAEPLVQDILRILRASSGEKHPDYARALTQLASIHESKREFAQAEANYRSALEIQKAILGMKHANVASTLNYLASVYFIQKDYPKAERCLREAVAAYEASRLNYASTTHRSLSTNTYNPLMLATALSAQLGKSRLAFETLEFDLARGILDEQSNRRLTLLSADELEKRSILNERLTVIQKRVLRLSTIAKRTEAEENELHGLVTARSHLNDQLSDLAVQLSRREVANLAEIQKAIPADAAIIAWVDDESKDNLIQEHWVVVLRSQGEPHWERLTGSGSKNEWTSTDHTLAKRHKVSLATTLDNRLSSQLYEQRFTSALKHLEEVRHLYVVSAHTMAGVPIETLTDRFTTSYIPSGTYLARIGGRAKSPNAQILALGDPIYHAVYQKGWSELPGTRVELTRLQVLFGKDNVTALTDEKASETELESLRLANKLKNYKYLHYATHGETRNLRAFDSNLILAHEKKAEKPFPEPNSPLIDAKLSAREVLDYWKLDAELVTLSACETALGKSAGGDGLLGFAQAFLLAGSRSVCLSLWKVDDTATALLMDRFYANLLGKREGLKTPMTKSLSLHEAKQWLRNLSKDDAEKRMKEIGAGVTRANRGKGIDLTIVDPKAEKPYAHPKFWAGFILIGDPN